MEELGRRFDAAAAEVAVIVVTPHNVHVEGHFAVVTAAHVGEWEVDGETRGGAPRAPTCRSSASRTAATIGRAGGDARSTGEPRCRSTSCARSASSSSPRRATCRSRSTSGWARRSRRCPGGVASDRERRHGHAHDCRRPVRLSTRRPRAYDAAAAGDPRLGPPRLPAARRAGRRRRRPTRSGSSSFCRVPLARKREQTSSRTWRRATSGCWWRRFRPRRRRATRPARP